MLKVTEIAWHYSSDSLTHRQFDIYTVKPGGIEGGTHQHICTVNNLSTEKLWTRDPNEALEIAQLIAAAPMMLETLKTAVRHAREAMPADERAKFDAGEGGPVWMLCAVNAISQATGGKK